MPVKRKLNKKRTKVPRNVKINQKGSKRVSQKKRGRKMSKRQRGGEGEELGQWLAKPQKIRDQSIDSYTHLKTFVPLLETRLQEMRQPNSQPKSECLTLAQELLAERKDGIQGFFTFTGEKREKCLNDPNFILDGKDADNNDIDSDFKGKNFVTIVDELCENEDLPKAFLFLKTLFSNQRDEFYVRGEYGCETTFCFNWRAFNSLLVYN